MNYRYHSSFEDYFTINNVTREELDVSSFFVDKEQKALIDFKEVFLSLQDKNFLIVGDYDCDGITSTTILKRLLQKLNIVHKHIIPSRSKDGYGLNETIVKMAYDHHFDVLFCVDNGVSASAALSLAKTLGLSVLILDHHEYSAIPECDGFLHPSLLLKDYQKLSAGGLTQLFSSLFFDDDLSLVYGGLSILSDMVGVLGYNRYLLKEMMKRLKQGGYHALDLLKGEGEYSYENLSFQVIPKINAISRMDKNPNVMVQYLLSDKETCLKSFSSINEVNEERKTLTSRLARKADSYTIYDKEYRILSSKEIPEGLCGLLANRLVSKSDKPVLVFHEGEEELKGSGRCPDSFVLYEHLLPLKGKLKSYGGHGQAIGLSMDKSFYDSFLSHIQNYPFQKKEVYTDAYCLSPDEMNIELFHEIRGLEPFGVDLKEPLFVLKEVPVIRKQIMAGKYPKFVLNDHATAISFHIGHKDLPFKDIIGKLSEDTYHYQSVSLIIEDLI